MVEKFFRQIYFHFAVLRSIRAEVLKPTVQSQVIFTTDYIVDD